MKRGVFTHSIRVVTIENPLWFVAKDVCKCLGIQVQPNGEPNVTVALRKLDPSETALYRIQGNQGGRTARVISEPGLYRLAMRSDKAQAKAFQDWVARDVLPAIRKDGMYVMGEEKVVTGEMGSRHRDGLVSKSGPPLLPAWVT